MSKFAITKILLHQVMSRFTTNCCPESRSEPGAGKNRVIWYMRRNCLVTVVAGVVCRVMRGLDKDELIDRWTLVGEELGLVASKRGAAKLGFGLMLRFYTERGPPRSPTARCIEHLAGHLDQNLAEHRSCRQSRSSRLPSGHERRLLPMSTLAVPRIWSDTATWRITMRCATI